MTNNLWNANRSEELLALLQQVRREMDKADPETLRHAYRDESTISRAIDLLIGLDDYRRAHPDPENTRNQPDGHLGATEPL